MVEFLKSLDLSDSQRFESMGQILDSMVQVLEKLFEDHEITLHSRSLGDLQDELEKVPDFHPIAAVLGTVRRFRKSINVKAPELDKIQQLQAMAIELIELTPYAAHEHVYRIRYQPVLENGAGVESPSGFKQFNLYHGSISHVSCQTLLISAGWEGDILDGQVINALKWRFPLDLSAPSLKATFSDCEVLCFDAQQLNSHFDRLIVLVPNGSEPLPISLQAKILNELFSILSAHEHLGLCGSDVGLSFLMGNRSLDKSEAVASLVLEALSWLKKSDQVQKMHCAVLHRSELELWNESMNKALGRSIVDANVNPIIETLRKELLSLLHAEQGGPLDSAVNPLVSALSVKGPLTIELVCTFSRTLCELIVRETSKQAGLKVSGDLLSSIERLRSEGIISPWISSYMHGVRVLGNKSVHPSKKPPKYKPERLEISDLSSTLMAIRCLLDFWVYNRRQ